MIRILQGIVYDMGRENEVPSMLHMVFDKYDELEDT